jgi:signal transduction histidine kinase
MLIEIDEWLERALRITRELAVDLSPPVLDKEGLGAAVRWLAGQMASLHGLKVSIEDDQSKGRVFPRDQRTLLFQVVRELLFNVVKHAETDSATVRLSNDDGSFQIEVADRGKGFDPQIDAAASDGFGLENLRHRLSLIDGELDLQSAPGSGTVATIRMPDSRGPAS